MARTKTSTRDDTKTLTTIIIWYNSDIRIDGQPVFFKSVYENGIKHINQL